MSDTPFTTIGDEPVEARIVAWVLGEASAFEAAELERLCREKPELMIFKRRMLALHDLLAEAENPQAVGAWKLPPEKRKAVEEILGEQQTIRLEVAKEKRIHRSGRRAFLAIAACVILTLVVLQLVGPVEYRSEAIIEVRPRHVGMSPLGSQMSESSGAGQMTPQFFGTEFEKIKSRNSLEKVVENLDLTDRWEVDKETALKILKDSVETENVRGTDLIKIQVNHPDKKDARDIAGEVVNSYKAYRQDIENKDAERQLSELNKAVRDQEDKVEERRKVLSTIARTKGIIYKGDDSLDGNGGAMAAGDESREEAIKRGLDAQDYVDAKREFEADQKLLQTMKLKQVGETISRRTPGESVEIHSDPVVMEASRPKAALSKLTRLWRDAPFTTKSAESKEAPLASTAPARTQPLETSLPKELIEGTPKPLNVPNLEAPAEGPAGSATWRSEESMLAAKPRVIPSAAAKPSAPASSRAETKKTMVANTSSVTVVPVPDVDVTTPSLDFGDGSDFGTGWGEGKNQEDGRLAGGVDIVGGAKFGLKSGLRSGDQAVNGNNIDAIPSRPERPTGGEAAAEKKMATGDMPVLGRLFEDKEIASPRDTGIVTDEVRYKIDDSDRPSAPGAAPNPAAEETTDEYWDTSKVLAEGKAKGKEYEIHAGYKNEYLFRGMDLDKDGAQIPDDVTELAKAVRDQEDKVEERRKVLATIVRTKGIIYKGQDSFYQTGGVDEDQGARSALETYHQLEREKMQLESQIGSLLKYDSDQLMVYAAGLDLPDNIIRNLYPQYQEAKRKLDADKAKGMGDKHPTVQATVDQVEAMKHQLDEGVINLRSSLQAQLDLASERLKKVETLKDQTREEAIKRGLDAQDYADAKREFEKEQELLQQMKLKLVGASIKPKPEPPKPDLAKLMEEIAASEEPYSTFSLNISDASFRIAQAAMDKGERPDPAGVKVEQFYNAVDYGDPAPAAGEPVSCEIEQAAHPVIPGRNLVRVALKTAAAGRSATQPLHLTLLVDQSGSMTRADRRAAMDAAMASLGKLLTENDLVNIVGFSRTSRLVADGMKGDEAGKKLSALVNQSASEGGTNLETAIELAGQMAQRRMLAGAQNRIVLFTDGAANLGDADPQRLAAKVGQLRQQGVAFDIAGIAADGLNDELLGELARKGNGRYYVVGKGAEEDFAKQLAGAFRPAAENVKVQVRFNPERVARYKLIGFEKDRLKTEDFRNDKVDAAELAAEEAGVAIYQIEPNPDGSGEIGEVSVRFRDTASGEMVERGWTIPHDAAAPAIDRATPSMQLATLAMFAAEKLKGGPLGEAIDFRQFAEPQANVKRFFGGDARVAEVLRMVEMLK